MNNMWSLPESLNIGGSDFQIRTDYRVILDILWYFDNPDFEDDEKFEICKRILYPKWRDIPQECNAEAIQKAVWFIDGGVDPTENSRSRTSLKLMDWEQDAQMIIPAINKVSGIEIRAVKYMHWWTFLSHYMEIGESLYTTVIGIRQKKAKGKKLDKSEEAFCRENKNLVDLKIKYSKEELAEQARLKAILDS